VSLSLTGTARTTTTKWKEIKENQKKKRNEVKRDPRNEKEVERQKKSEELKLNEKM
jgi:hypothetical protein